MTDKYEAVKVLTEKAEKATSAVDALQYSQAALNTANAIARAQEMRGNPGGGSK